MKFSPDFLIRGLCLAVIGLVSCAALAKPQLPLNITLEPVQAAVIGQPVEFKVRATVTMDAENLHITVLIPASVKVISGELQWQGRLLKGEVKQLRFTVMADSAVAQTVAQTIEARAYIVGGDLSLNANENTGTQSGHTAQLLASAIYVMGSDTAKAVAAQASPLINAESPRIVQRNGRAIAEYPLRP